MLEFNAVPFLDAFVAEADVDANEDSLLGRLASGVMVVRSVSHALCAWSSSSSGLKLRWRSPRPSMFGPRFVRLKSLIDCSTALRNCGTRGGGRPSPGPSVLGKGDKRALERGCDEIVLWYAIAGANCGVKGKASELCWFREPSPGDGRLSNSANMVS